MLSIARAVTLPLLSLLLVIFGAQFFSTFTTVQLHRLGLSDLWVGALNASYYVGMLGFSLVSSPFIARMGHARAFACAAVAIVISILSMGINADMMLWMAMRAVAGAAMAVLFIVIESWMLVVSGEGARGRVLSVYMFVLYSSQASSQYLMDWLSLEAAQPFIWAALLCALAVLPILCDFREVREEPRAYAPAAGLKQLLRYSPLGFLGAFLSGILLSAIYAFFPKIALENGLSVASLMAAAIFGGVCMQWPLGYLSDMYCRSKLLIIASSLLPLPCLALLLAGGDGAGAALASFLLGGIAFGIYPQSISIMCQAGGESSLTTVCSIATLVYGVGAVIGPLLFAGLAYHFGVAALLLGLAAVGLLLASIGVLTLAGRPRWATAERRD